MRTLVDEYQFLYPPVNTLIVSVGCHSVMRGRTAVSTLQYQSVFCTILHALFSYIRLSHVQLWCNWANQQYRHYSEL